MSLNLSFKFDLNYLEANSDRVNDTINIAVNYLIDLKEPNKIFKYSNRFNALIFIGKSIYHNFDINYNSLFVSKNFEVFLSDMMLYLYTINHELDFSIEIDPENAEKAVDLIEKHLLLLSYVLYITNIISRRSKEFCIQFVLKQGLKACLLFLNDDNFIKKNKDFKINNLTGFPLDLPNYITLNILNLSTKTCDEYRKIWNDLDSVRILLKIAKAQNSSLLNAYWSIVYILDDQKVENLKEIYSIVNLLIKLLINCNNDFNTNYFDREDRQIDFNGKILDCEVHVVKDENFVSTSITGLLECLFKLSVNDKLKNEIYLKHDIKNCIKTFLSKGNIIEINFSLKLLAQLCFSQTVSKDLAEDSELMDTLKSLLKKNTNSIEDNAEKIIYPEVLSLIKQIKWNINEHTQKSYLTNVVKTISNEHVMISYNSANREQCLKIKEKIESIGFKVWLDLNNNAYESNLDEMAKAIDNSLCVIICVTEKYRQSINCQIEAQYAFKMNKNIIPLIMQEDMQDVKGWLGSIMNDKTSINFTSSEFELCISRLKYELEAYAGKEESLELPSNEKIPTPINDSDQEVSQIETNKNNDKKNIPVIEWTEIEVKDWFTKNNINMSIYEYLQATSGKILKQMHQIKISSSEFFYQSLREIENIKFHEIILFASCLDELLI